MPKIRCSGCETVLNAPDKAIGKVIACPKCGTKIKVEGAAAAVAPKPRARAAAPAAPKDQVIDFAKLDLERLQDEGSGGVCPYCAAELNPEDPVCRNCGMNVEKGQMDAREHRRRTLKGADPNLFYTQAWKESLEFVKENLSLVFRTGWVWALFSTMNAICTYMSLVYCKNWPTKAFWGGLAIISALGVAGWFISLAMAVISSSMVKEKFRADRFYFDFFKCAAGGGRVVFWPMVVLGPLFPAALFFYLFMLLTNPNLAISGTFVIGLIGGLAILPVLVMPIALPHMTCRHTYKAWIMWELLILFAKNAAATLFFLFVALIAFLPVIGFAALIVYLIGAGNPLVSEFLVGAPLEDAPAPIGASEGTEVWSPGLNGNITLWFMKLLDLGQDQNTFTYAALKGLVNVIATTLIVSPIAYLAAFPGVFIIRMWGLFAFYRTYTLDYVQRILPGTPATFWVRYLAHTVDLAFMPLSGFLVTANPKTMMIQWVVTGFTILIWLFQPALIPVGLLALALYTNWNYWVVQESSQLKSTLGKDTFGLIVITDRDKVVSMKTATLKWFLRNLWYFSFGLPFIMMVFNKDKLTLHDQVTRTKVVFKGDK